MTTCIFSEADVNRVYSKYVNMPIKNIHGHKGIYFDKSFLEVLYVKGFSFIVHKNDTCIED